MEKQLPDMYGRLGITYNGDGGWYNLDADMVGGKVVQWPFDADDDRQAIEIGQRILADQSACPDIAGTGVLERLWFSGGDCWGDRVHQYGDRLATAGGNR